MLDCFRKDLVPSKTIKRIRAILKENSIKVKEVSFCIGNLFFFTRIELIDFPGIGVNGKGFSKEAALASAYAELMERLQTGFLLRSFFLNKENFFVFQEEYPVEQSDFLNDQIKIFSSPLIPKLKQLSKVKNFTNCSDFIDLRTGKKKLLPHRLMNIICKTNGLCAGNSYEEAVVQGICEILERFVHKKIILEDLTLPDISKDSFSSIHIMQYLDKIESIGLHYQIKDCSLNGIYPVIGILVSNIEKDRAGFVVGSDVDINIALSRCVLELFQGLKTKKDILNKLQPVKTLSHLGRGCSAGVSSACIDVNGDIKICPSASFVIGNLKNESFKRIWNTKKMRDFRSFSWVPSSCTVCNFFLKCRSGCKIEIVESFSKNICDKFVEKRFSNIWNEMCNKKYIFSGSFIRKDFSHYTIISPHVIRKCNKDVLLFIKSITGDKTCEEILHMVKNKEECKNLLISLKIDMLLKEIK